MTQYDTFTPDGIVHRNVNCTSSRLSLMNYAYDLY